MLGVSAVAPIKLEVLDAPILTQTNFGPDQQRWLSNMVDIINASFMILNSTFNNLITAQGINIGGSGAGPITVSVIGLTATGFVAPQIISTTNPNITIANVVPGLNSFAITFSADPGASAIIKYLAFTQQPQG